MEIGMGWMSTAASVDRYMLLSVGCWVLLLGAGVVVWWFRFYGDGRDGESDPFFGFCESEVSATVLRVYVSAYNNACNLKWIVGTEPGDGLAGKRRGNTETNYFGF
jgi:hypothetical protein